MRPRHAAHLALACLLTATLFACASDGSSSDVRFWDAPEKTTDFRKLSDAELDLKIQQLIARRDRAKKAYDEVKGTKVTVTAYKTSPNTDPGTIKEQMRRDSEQRSRKLKLYREAYEDASTQLEQHRSERDRRIDARAK